MTDLTALKYTAEHEWVALDGDVATVGITDYAADKLGDVVFVELPAVGSPVTAATVVGEIESTKSVGELYAPVSGEVVEYASTCKVPIVHKAGEVSIETHGVAHWWKNVGRADAVLISADLLHQSGDAHVM